MRRRKSTLWFLLFLFLGVTLLGGCSGKKDNVIRLGLDNTAEEAIIGEILVGVIEANTDLTVEVTSDLAGGETVIHPAMLKGDLDLYPEYTGTAWLAILKETDIPDRESLQQQLFEAYREQFNFEWVGLYGFNNSYGLAVAEQVAAQYNLVTYSDLAAVSDELSFRAESGFFEREDGYNGLCDAYGFEFKSAEDVSFSLKYNAIADRQADVINIFTTDGRLSEAGVVVLEDDLGYFPEYRCGTVVRAEVLEKHPELREALLLMEDLIGDSDMSSMNYRVESEGADPAQVAEDFLKEKGLL